MSQIIANNRPFGAYIIEVQTASKIVCEVWSLESCIKIRSFLEEIITSPKDVLKDSESDMAVGNRQLGNQTHDTAESNVKVKQTVGY